MKTTDEIVARIEEIKEDDWLGTQRSDLVMALPWEQASTILRSPAGEETWVPETQEQTLTRARDYLAFAWGKVEGHRGISASRSIDHYSAWLWLTQDEAVFTAWSEVPYPQYGAPQVAMASAVLGVPIPTDKRLVRMIAGKPCRRRCDEGCDTDGQHGVVTTFEVT